MAASNTEKAPWVRLGDYIERSMVNNSDLKYGEELIEGVNSNGEFCKTKADLLDINLKPYKLVNNGDFVYNPSRFNIGSIAYRTQGFCIVSHLYVVFRLNELGEQKIDPLYLYMYIYRKEFFRMITYLNFGSQRPEFNFFELSEIKIPLPSIETQRKLAAVYRGLKELAEENEKLLEPLSKSCQAFIADCKKKYPMKRLGDCIEDVDERNEMLKQVQHDNHCHSEDDTCHPELVSGSLGIESVRGISTEKTFIDTKADMMNVELSSYKIVSSKEFVYVADTSRRGDKVALAFNNSTNDYLVSSIYTVFRVSNESKLLPEYLMMFFKRTEFDRYARFNSWGSARETFDWSEMCRVKIPLPPIEIQQKITDLYNCYEECKRIATQAREKIKNICPALVQKAAHSK